jgi:hypothetical protein
MEKLCWDRIEDLPEFVRQILKYHLEMEAPVWLADMIARRT